MNDPSTLEAIFFDALEKGSPTERAAFLDQACAGEPTLRKRVEKMLAAQVQAGSFLEQPAADLAATVVEGSLAERSGTILGPYKLLQPLGEGGMGTVWMAQQNEPVKRLVAVKLIKAGMDSRQVIARFEAERQALALMDHPNIARVFDGGTTESGRPYFVMELVHGVPITRYCDDNRLTLRQRLELFIPVCQAIQHAHQKGIIHRDIKPSNVLVTLYEGKPVPKVIDFGVAKAMEQKLTERTLLTQCGTLVGTLEYMSPEQAEMSPLGIDTRSDIYSLGVLLYELLTGSTPLRHEQIKEATYAEILRQIKEEEPPSPSKRLRESGAAMASISANRRTEPAKLTGLVRGELDWIVMKALEKDRNRRYETATGFALDGQRYLNDEPVQAGPPSQWYRLRKFVRRNKGSVLATMLLLFALVSGIAGTTWGLWHAESARGDAQYRLEQLEKGVDVITEMVRNLDPGAEENAGKPLRVLLAERVENAAAQLDGGVIDDPLVVARLHHQLGMSLLSLGYAERASVLLSRAGTTQASRLGSEHEDTLTTRDHLARAYKDAAKFAEAIRVYEEVRDVRARQFGADHPVTLTSLHNLAEVHLAAGRLRRAIELLERVRDERRKQLGDDDIDTLMGLNSLAEAYRAGGRAPEAIVILERVRDASLKQYGAGHLATLTALQNLARAYRTVGRKEDAVALFEQVRDLSVKRRGADHPFTLAALNELAREAGDASKAVSLLEQVRDARARVLGADHPDTLVTLADLARALDRAGGVHSEKAIAILEQVREVRLQRGEADHPDTLTALYNRAWLYSESVQRRKEGIALHEQVWDARTRVLGADHPDTLVALCGLARAYNLDRRVPDALRLHQQAAAGMEKLGFQHEEAHGIVVALWNCHESAKEYDRAEVWRRKWIAVLRERIAALSGRKEPPPYHVELHWELLGLGKNLLEQKKYTEAESVLRECLAIRASIGGWSAHRAESLLGHALLGQEKYVEAEQMLLRGYARLKEREPEVPGLRSTDLAVAAEFLVRLYAGWGKLEETAKWAAVFKELCSTESIYARTLLRVGNDVFGKKQYAAAALLLRRALDVLQVEAPSKLLYLRATLGDALLAQGQYADAESVLREYRKLRDGELLKKVWVDWYVESLLGGALLGQRKYADAEPLLLGGYDGMRRVLEAQKAYDPETIYRQRDDALERLVKLYEALDKPDEAAKWREELKTQKKAAEQVMKSRDK